MLKCNKLSEKGGLDTHVKSDKMKIEQLDRPAASCKAASREVVARIPAQWSVGLTPKTTIAAGLRLGGEVQFIGISKEKV